MKIIAFTGMPGSGKSEAVAVARSMGIPVVRMGDAVWEETRIRGLELNDKNVGKVAQEMRESHGKDIWAQRTIAKIRAHPPSDCIIIDGVRSIEEVDTFKTALGSDFILIAINTSDETRMKRVLKRRRADDNINAKDIKERDERELGWGLGKVLSVADIIVDNENDLSEFQDRIRRMLQGFIKKEG
ncbi:MAG: AAA family ATPase [Candidatus Thermoplasmatota archaeon]